MSRELRARLKAAESRLARSPWSVELEGGGFVALRPDTPIRVLIECLRAGLEGRRPEHRAMPILARTVLDPGGPNDLGAVFEYARARARDMAAGRL